MGIPNMPQRRLPKTHGKSMDFDKYDLWQNIFLRSDYETLATCSKICKLFSSVLKSNQFWLLKCDYEGIAVPPLKWRRFLLHHKTDEAGTSNSQDHFDYRTIYRGNPYYRNLVRPLRPDDTLRSLEQYMQFEQGGAGFDLEREPVYAATHPDVPVCLATSYDWCKRMYMINFKDFGIEDWVMDKIRPKITVSEMQICRTDCAARYEICVQLLKNNEYFDRNVVLPRFVKAEKRWDQWVGGQQWETVAFDFTDYPVGIRNIGILSQGKDEQFWAGHYGSKFGNTQVTITFPEEPKFFSEDAFPDPEKKFLGNPLPIRMRTLRNFGLRGLVRHRRHS